MFEVNVAPTKLVSAVGREHSETEDLNLELPCVFQDFILTFEYNEEHLSTY
jgi:hypothetical protein